MAVGPIVLAVFAAVWAIAGGYALGWGTLAAVIAIQLSAALTIGALRVGRNLAPRSEAERRRIGRLVGIWSGIEGIAIFVGINVVMNLGHSEMCAAVMCLVVGLHFFPLAYGLPRRSLAVAGVILTVLGISGLALSQALPTATLDLAAAGGLWLAALLGLADMRHMAAAHTKL